jgi:hypothetical protein
MKVIADSALTGKSLFDYLVKNKAEIIEMKRASFKTADIAEVHPATAELLNKKEGDKAYRYKNNEEAGTLERTIIANTYLWLDSHDDVHLPNLFAKSLQERGQKAPHLHDHKFELSAKVGKPLKYDEREISWKELGISKSGKTMALFMESEIKKSLNGQVYEAYLSDEIDQHSVGMRYIKIDLAVNDEDYKEEYKVWQSVIDKIGNKEAAEKQGYFFAVKEAVLIETSAVLLGSNELTPTMHNPDMDFIEGMIPHHEMAIEMANEFEGKVSNKELKEIIKNIKSSQADEIKRMKRIKDEMKSQPPKGTAYKQEPVNATLNAEELLKYYKL